MAVYNMSKLVAFSQQEFGRCGSESSNKCPFLLSKCIFSWAWTYMYTSLMPTHSTGMPKAVYHGCRTNFEKLKLIHNSAYSHHFAKLPTLTMLCFGSYQDCVALLTCFWRLCYVTPLEVIHSLCIHRYLPWQKIFQVTNYYSLPNHHNHIHLLIE